MSKKAERIYEDTAKVIDRHVRRGTHFDSTPLVYGNSEIIYKRTVSDLMAIWQRKINSLAIHERMYERHPEDAERYAASYGKFARDVETARRMYLSIKNAEEYAI